MICELARIDIASTSSPAGRVDATKDGHLWSELDVYFMMHDYGLKHENAERQYSYTAPSLFEHSPKFDQPTLRFAIKDKFKIFQSKLQCGSFV